MNISTEKAAEAVLVNFRRLSPTDRREVLDQLLNDLDAPQQMGEIEEADPERGPGASIPPPDVLGWWEETFHRPNIAAVLQQFWPDIIPGALDDPQQRLAIDQRLSGLSPEILIQVQQRLEGRGKKTQTLTPGEILEKTWGAIKGMDPALLREIIEDEEYCGY
jgi:hypothetical protein